MKQAVDISIIVLNFNTKELTVRCLQSIERSKKQSDRWEIILVDNASVDGSIEKVKKEFPDIKILALEKNIGFAAGNNVAIRQAMGTYVLLLNSDTEITRRAITESYDFMENTNEAGVVTCRLVLPAGSLDPACHRGFPTPWAAVTYFLGLETVFPRFHLFGQYHQGYKNEHVAHEIDSPSGAFYFIRKKTIEQVGLLDEEYFMYGEDLDWSYRIKKAGWKIFYNPAAQVIHFKKKSGRDNENKQIRQQTRTYFYDAMRLFYKKHYKHTYSPMVYGLVLLGIKIRSLL
jgi:hypothetical protein